MEQETAHRQLREAAALAKCLRCGAMERTLGAVADPDREGDLPTDLVEDARDWLDAMDDVDYGTLGCDRCYPVEASDLLDLS